MRTVLKEVAPAPMRGDTGRAMSQANVERLRAAIDALRGDRSELLRVARRPSTRVLGLPLRARLPAGIGLAARQSDQRVRRYEHWRSWRPASRRPLTTRPACPP